MSEQQVGPHRVVRQRQGIAVIHFGKSPEHADMVKVLDVLTALMEARPFVLLLDFRKVQTLSAEVRRVVGERTRGMKILGFAMFGASFHMKVIARLVNSAISLFRNEVIPQEFFDTEQAAQAWGGALYEEKGGSTA